MTGALILGVCLMVLQLVLRRRPAVQFAGVFVIALVMPTPGENLAVEIPIRIVSAVVLVFVFFRFGILSIAAAGFVSMMIESAPTTLDPSRWYFGRSLAVLLLLAGVVAWGFRLALADQPIFGKALLEDET